MFEVNDTINVNVFMCEGNFGGNVCWLRGNFGRNVCWLRGKLWGKRLRGCVVG